MSGTPEVVKGPGPAVERVGVALTVLFFALSIFAEPGPGTDVLVCSVFWVGAGVYLLGRAWGQGWRLRFTGVEALALVFALLAAGSTALAIRRGGQFHALPAMTTTLRHVTWMLAILVVADQCRAGHARLWLLALVGGAVARGLAALPFVHPVERERFYRAWYEGSLADYRHGELALLCMPVFLATLYLAARSAQAKSWRAVVGIVVAGLCVAGALPGISPVLLALLAAVGTPVLFRLARRRSWTPGNLWAAAVATLVVISALALYQSALTPGVGDRRAAAARLLEGRLLGGHGAGQFARVSAPLLDVPQSAPAQAGSDILDCAVSYGIPAALALLAMGLLALRRMADPVEGAGEAGQAWGRWEWMGAALILLAGAVLGPGLSYPGLDSRVWAERLIGAAVAGLAGWFLLPLVRSPGPLAWQGWLAGLLMFLGFSAGLPGLFAGGTVAGAGFVVLCAIGIGVWSRGRDVDAGRLAPTVLGTALLLFGVVLAGGAGAPWWEAERLARTAQRRLEAALAAKEQSEYLTALQELDRAEEELGRARKLSPKDADPLALLARVRRQQFAVRTLHADVTPQQIEEQSMRLLDAAGLAAQGERLGRSAEMAHEQGLAYHDLAEAYRRIGNEAATRGQLNAAISAYRRAVSGHPAQPRYRYALARALAESGQAAEARKEFAQAVRFHKLARDPDVRLSNAEQADARARAEP